MSESSTTAAQPPDDPAQRVLAMIQLRATAWSIVEGALRAQHPDWSDDAISRTTRERFIDSTG